ncbi:hypothetical protein BPLS_P5953 [Bathymodiolus platifrons methanotrophic gill symbiont]|uniref:hypothetical protein n=1 Tax=Bathymodiolus platifrons methanotrophic gill symbiont TaxID=113268 RepID=UPI001B766727|nr:hypothetical protein [Bathymodiolus platifrons methanotrophic gill symbiont]GFO77485.1 hypothetical protein BPLS_P5953 [Bathymodiolus platifrons methanotrophic gill symbiont]
MTYSKPFPLGKYKAAFLIPLGEYGWEFEIKYFTVDILSFLIGILGLVLEESYLGIDKYIGEGIQASVIHDDEEKIEHVSFQIYGDNKKGLEEAFISSDLENSCELFFPD